MTKMARGSCNHALPHNAKQNFNLRTERWKASHGMEKQRSEVTPYPKFMLQAASVMNEVLLIWAGELKAAGYNPCLTCCWLQMLAFLSHASFLCPLRSAFGIMLVVCPPTVTLQVVLQPSLLPSQLNRFASLDKMCKGTYAGCLCCFSLAIEAKLSMIIFCLSLLVETEM